jgi:hypothetical protein
MDRILEQLKESWKMIETAGGLAPGAEQIVSDLSELPTEEEFNGVGLAEAKPIPDAPVRDIDPMDIARSKTDDPNIAQGIAFNRANPSKQYKRDKSLVNPETGSGYKPAERPQRLIHSSTLLKILTPSGKKISEKQLKQLITQRPESIIQQNSKLAASGANANEVFYDLTLPAFQGLFYNEAENKFQVVKTCPSAGACKAYCYATSGGYVQYEGPWLSATRTINFLMNDYEGFKQKVLSELKAAVAANAKRGKKVVLRWHDAGDFFSKTYLMLAFDVAKQTPETRHYAYTKQVDLVNKYNDVKPDNFIFNFSKGGTQDRNVDFTTAKHSKVVPDELFRDLNLVKGQPLSPQDKEEIKKRVTFKYDLDPGSVVTYDELVKLPVDNTKKYNVIVKPGDGDDAAARTDVLGTLLLIH